MRYRRNMSGFLDGAPKGISLDFAPGINGVSVLTVRESAHAWRHFVDQYQFIVACPKSVKGAELKYDCNHIKGLPVNGPDFAVCAPGDMLRTAQIKKPVTFCFLRFDKEVVHQAMFDRDSEPDVLDFRYPGVEDPALAMQLRMVVQQALSAITDPLERETVLVELASGIFGALAYRGPKTAGLETLCQRRALLVQEMIRCAPERRWALDDLAVVTGGISKARLANSFKAATGMTIVEYLHSVRIARSLDLIRRKKLRLSEVAHAVGYYDQASFTTSFRRIMGLTPGKFVRASIV